MDNYVIAWDEKLAIGDPRVDAQHRHIIEAIGTLPDKPRPGDAQLLGEILEYAATHFADEEAFMAEIDYPDLASHARTHKTLTRTLLAYKREYDAGERDLYAFKHFMYRWVRDHIMDEDRLIADYLRRREPQAIGGESRMVDA